MTMCSSATYEVKIFSSVVLGPYSTRAPKCQTMTVESSFLLTINFATLYLGKTKSFLFQGMKDYIHYELKSFMKSIKVLKLL